MSVSYTKLRTAIESVEDKPRQMFLKAVYLFAARPIEVAGELTSADRRSGLTQPYGLTSKKCFLSETEPPDIPSYEVAKLLRATTNKEEICKIADRLSQKISVAVFQLNIAKQSPVQGQPPPPRLVAVPIDEKYEPWTRELYNYIRDAKDREYVFPFNRQDVWEYVTRKANTFRGMYYTVEDYSVKKHDQRTVTVAHPRPIKFGALRIARAMELKEKYGFGLEDLGEYIGLQLDLKATPLPKTPRRMYFDNWQRYVKKLCKSAVAHT